MNRLLTKAQRTLKTSLSRDVRDMADGDLSIQRGYESLALSCRNRCRSGTEGDALTPAGFTLAQQLGAFLKAAPFG